MSIYSQKTEKKAKKYKLSVEEYYFILLYSSGEDIDDAWNATVSRGLSWTKQARKDEIDKILDSQGARTLMYELGSSDESGEAVEKDIDYTDKDQLLKALAKEAKREKTPSSRAKILGQIADLQRMKQDEVKTEDTTIHYYLPLSCNQCPLKQKYDKSKE